MIEKLTVQQRINLFKQYFELNIKTLATGYDFNELRKMKFDKNLREYFSLLEIEYAIKDYYNSEFTDIRANITKEKVIDNYEVTLQIEDYGEEFPFHLRTIEDYLKQQNFKRFKIREIKKIAKISDLDS